MPLRAWIDRNQAFVEVVERAPGPVKPPHAITKKGAIGTGCARRDERRSCVKLPAAVHQLQRVPRPLLPTWPCCDSAQGGP